MSGNVIREGSGTVAPPRVLVADDHGDVLQALHLLLKTEGYHVKGVSSPDALMHALARESFDVVLIDLNYTRDTTSGREGLELLSRIRALNRDVPVVAMTAWGSIELAVDAMRTGVDDFIQKPWDNAQLLSHLRTQIEQGRAHRRLQQVPSDSGRASELAAAREIQRNLLPTTLPAAPGLQVAVFWEPAGDVGGDFYDGASLSESSAWLCIGDVAGKGISAALLMASVQSMVRSSARAQLAPAALCASVNRELSTQMTSGRFVTFFYCVYDATTRRLTYTNAGHNPPLLVHSDGNAVRLSRGGPVLGVFPQSQFDSGEVELADGDRLVLFTDGITEARSASGGEFGEERLERIVAASPQVSARALSDRILSAARTFRGEAFEDDATLIVMEVGGR
jgi:sigma-B regulation protein RsbU (phosphoserine phosphatase)